MNPTAYIEATVKVRDPEATMKEPFDGVDFGTSEDYPGSIVVSGPREDVEAFFDYKLNIRGRDFETYVTLVSKEDETPPAQKPVLEGSVTFDKFMDRILINEGAVQSKPKKLLDSPQRLRAARIQERPLGRTRFSK